MSLTAQPSVSQDFFIAGGTLPLQSHSYIERAADTALLDALLKGRFCYVLNSRQMGKSSLCVRTMSRLETQGVQCAFVDITKIGGQNVTPEQWYAGLAIEVGRALNLRTQFLDYWKAEGHVSPMQRFFGVLHDVALARLTGQVVIFIDEIDSTRSLPFNTDEFFAGVRECFNRRVQDETYERLTFCFLGVAIPSDLIHDARTTPFNIGERIYLKDFTYEELAPLSKMLGAHGEITLRRVFYWTNGHPFLTQSICRTLVDRQQVSSEKDVDDLISCDLLEAKVRETNINLSDVGNRVLNGYADGDDVAKFRADILSAFRKSISGKETIQDDESNRVTAVLKLSGLMRSEGRTLRVRNRIYERVFDKTWIRENMPGQELRRQKRAFWLGVLRTAAIAFIIIGIVGTLAYRNDQLRREANSERDRANYEVYVADMNLMTDLWRRGDIDQMRKVLSTTKGNPAKGWEWNLWNHLSYSSLREFDLNGGYGSALSPDGKKILARMPTTINVLDASTFEVLRTIPAMDTNSRHLWFPDSRRFIESANDGNSYIVDSLSGKTEGKINDTETGGGPQISPDGRWTVGNDGKGEPLIIDLQHLTTKTYGEPQAAGNVGFSPAAQIVTYSERPRIGHGRAPRLYFFQFPSLKPLGYIEPRGEVRAVFTKDGRHLITGSSEGWIEYWDVATRKELWAVKGHTEGVKSLSISSDGGILVTTGWERFSHAYAISDKGAQLINTFPDASFAMVSPDGSTAYVCYWTIRAYDTKVPATAPASHFPKDEYQLGVVYPNGWMGAVTVSGSAFYMNAFGDQQGHPMKFTGVPVGPGLHHPWTFFNNPKGGLDIETSGGNLIANLPTQGPARGCAESPDGSKVVVAEHQSAQVWDIAAKQILRTYTLPSRGSSLDLYNDGTLAIGLIDGYILVCWPDGRVKTDYLGIGTITAIKFSVDGKLIIASENDDKATVLDATTGAVIHQLRGHSQTVTNGDISPDDTRYATASVDRSVRIWDAKSGRTLSVLDDYDAPVLSLQFTTDGKSLITFDSSGAVRIWPTDNSWKQN